MTLLPPDRVGLARELEDCATLAHDLARDLVLALARDLDRDRAGALALARALASGFDPIVGSIAALDLGRPMARALDRHRAPLRALACALECPPDLPLGRGLDRDLARTRGLVVLFDRLRRDAGQVADEFAAAPESGGDGNVGSWPVGMARWTTGCAARILPAAHRARWQQEWESELAELAGQGATRRQQLDYGLQVLFNAFSLRRAVGSPVAQRAKDG